jgi:hypothetical protein
LVSLALPSRVLWAAIDVFKFGGKCVT